MLCPVALLCVAHTVSQQIPAILEMSRGCRAAPSLPSKKRPCRTYLATLLSLCRRRSSLQKRIALHGGLAATLTPIALHCAKHTSAIKTRNALSRSKAAQHSQSSFTFAGMVCFIDAGGNCGNSASGTSSINRSVPRFKQQASQIAISLFCCTRNRPIYETEFLKDFAGPLSLPAPFKLTFSRAPEEEEGISRTVPTTQPLQVAFFFY